MVLRPRRKERLRTWMSIENGCQQSSAAVDWMNTNCDCIFVCPASIFESWNPSRFIPFAFDVHYSKLFLMNELHTTKIHMIGSPNN